MFGWLKSVPFSDPVLGEFHRKGGAWRGEVALGDVRAPLTLPGSRAAPDALALDAARRLPAEYPGWRRVIEAALFDHFAPYAEASVAATRGAAPAEQGVPRIARPDQVWQHTAVAFVAVVPFEGELAVEIGYQVAWDEDHTLGARLRNGRLIELNGSVVPP
jgi:hypothetical protein